jgi:hypothetical protein
MICLTRQDELNFFRGLKNALVLSVPIDGFIAWVIWRLL